LYAGDASGIPAVHNQAMNNPLILILLIGILYIVSFQVLSLSRWEGISRQFIVEGVGVTGLAVLGMLIGGVRLHPFIFLILLYLLTMRVRLLVDLGNRLAERGRLSEALTVYQFALRCFPDQAAQIIGGINLGAAYVSSQQPERAISVLERVQTLLSSQGASTYKASCWYNLGMAYRCAGREADASQKFREIAEIAPFSQYARLAERACAAANQKPDVMRSPQKE
jgi:tetratricopeptide (TPR) repeat protein